MDSLNQRHNPYFVLGIDFGSELSVVKAAWARQARLARRGGSRHDLESLNQALHDVEHADEDLATSMRWFRVPANRATSNSVGEYGLFRPAPIPIARRSEPTSREALEVMAREITAAAARRLVATATLHSNPNPYLD
jgi:hypothetical protein